MKLNPFEFCRIFFKSGYFIIYIFFRLQPCSMPWTQSIATRKRKPMFLSMPSTRCTYWKRRKWKKLSWRDRRRHEKKYTAWWARRTTRRRNPVSKEHYRNTDFIFLNWDVPPPHGLQVIPFLSVHWKDAQKQTCFNKVFWSHYVIQTFSSF